MPSPPELREGGSGVGVREVSRELQSQHPAQAHRHAGVAVEVQVELKGVGKERHPSQGGGDAFVANGGHVLPELAHPVGQQELEAQADAEFPQAAIHHVKPHRGIYELRRGVAVVEDGARTHMGKEQEVRPGTDQGALGKDAAAVDVHQVGCCLEGEKAQSQGKGFRLQHGGQGEEGEQCVSKEGKVFKPHKRQKIEEKPYHQPGLGMAAPADDMPEAEVDEHHQTHEPQLPRRLPAAPVVKDQAAKQKPGCFDSGGKKIIEDKKDREKNE